MTVIFDNPCTNRASVEADGGAIVGSDGAFDSSLGFDTGADGSIELVNLTNHTLLQNSFSLSFTLTTIPISEFDDDVSNISGSDGLDDPPMNASPHVFSCLRSDLTTQTWRGFRNVGTNKLRFRHQAQGTTGVDVSSVDKESTIRVEFILQDDVLYTKVDGVIVDSNDRTVTTNSEDFYKIILGAGYLQGSVGGYGQFNVAYIKDVLITNDPTPIHPVENNQLTLGGDSYGQLFLDNESIARDAFGANTIPRLAFRESKWATVKGVGTSSATMCDAAIGGNLSDDFASWAAIAQGYFLMLAGNNDIDKATSAETTDGSTGTLANYFAACDLIAAEGRVDKIGILTVGSVYNWTATPEYGTLQGNRDILLAIQQAFVDGWDAARPQFAGLVELVSLESIVGDFDDNTNFQGGLNEVGSLFRSGLGGGDDRHLSALGYNLLSKHVYTRMKAVSTMADQHLGIFYLDAQDPLQDDPVPLFGNGEAQASNGSLAAGQIYGPTTGTEIFTQFGAYCTSSGGAARQPLIGIYEYDGSDRPTGAPLHPGQLGDTGINTDPLAVVLSGTFSFTPDPGIFLILALTGDDVAGAVIMAVDDTTVGGTSSIDTNAPPLPTWSQSEPQTAIGANPIMWASFTIPGAPTLTGPLTRPLTRSLTRSLTG